MDADDIVLVVLVNAPRDLELARAEHWYRIPVRHAPPQFTQARYIAFYLTKAFGEAKWTIGEYAPVRGHELVRRRDLFPDELNHPRAEETYYKVQLGTLIPLPRPITSKRGRRLLFVSTTGQKLSRAVEINDLLGESEADDALWDALKSFGICAERQITVRDVRARYRVDFWVPCRRGNLVVVLGKTSRRLPRGKAWRALRFSEAEVIGSRAKCIAQIRKMVRECGGPLVHY